MDLFRVQLFSINKMRISRVNKDWIKFKGSYKNQIWFSILPLLVLPSSFLPHWLAQYFLGGSTKISWLSDSSFHWTSSRSWCLLNGLDLSLHWQSDDIHMASQDSNWHFRSVWLWILHISPWFSSCKRGEGWILWDCGLIMYSTCNCQISRANLWIRKHLTWLVNLH